MFRASIEVAWCSLIVHHREVLEVREGGGDGLDEEDQVSYLVVVHPEHLKMGQGREHNVRCDVVPVQYQGPQTSKSP